MAQQNDSKPASPEGKTALESASGGSFGLGMGEKDTTVNDVGAPYGTRSRNRNGNSRPNYAEDKDIEIEMYDYYLPEKKEKENGGKKSSSRKPSAAGNPDLVRANGGSRKPVWDGWSSSDAMGPDSHKGASQNGHRDSNSGSGSGTTPASQAAPSQVQAPATASVSAGASQSSRKRKTAGGQTSGNAGSTSKKGGVALVAQTPPGLNWPDTNMLTFENCSGQPENGRMVADNGTVLTANDHVYLVCEPPGEPYYLGRIMEFLHTSNNPAKPVDAIRINWYYRPKDIGRKVQDTRLVFATMHSDITPLTALRGKCQIRHRCEIDNMEEYRRTPDSFWFEKLYDRYIQKNYDLIPTPSIVNVPEKVKKVLDERWKYVLVEQGRGKELTSAVKSCKRCSGYCARIVGLCIFDAGQTCPVFGEQVTPIDNRQINRRSERWPRTINSPPPPPPGHPLEDSRSATRSQTNLTNASLARILRIARERSGVSHDPIGRRIPSSQLARSVDGLGDRDRSLSPDWDMLQTTLTPDPQPPSAGSSFASTAVPQTANQVSSVPPSGSDRIDVAHLDPACESGCELSDPEDLFLEEYHRRMHRRRAELRQTSLHIPDLNLEGSSEGPFSRRSGSPGLPSDVAQRIARLRSQADAWAGRLWGGPSEDETETDRSRQNREDSIGVGHGAFSGDDDWTGMQRIVRGLAARGDIPDEWWAEVGLSRTLRQEDTS